MPTVSFPITITISIDIPDFAADAFPQADTGNAWQFTAACETVASAPQAEIKLSGSGAGQSPRPEQPQIVTNSDYAPAEADADNPHDKPGEDRADGGERDAPPVAPPLTHQQRLAVLYLVTGSTLEQAAEMVGVSRNTLQRWKRENPGFEALYKSYSDDLQRSAEAKLLALSAKVTEVLTAHIASGNFRAAMQVAKGLGILTGRPRSPLSTAEELLAEYAIETPFDVRSEPHADPVYAASA